MQMGSFKIKEIEIIESWIRLVVDNDRVSKYDDLHINLISDRWNPSALWISGGLECLEIAASIRDRSHLSLTVALGFSLQANNYGSGSDFKSRMEVEKQLTKSPPSLYLFDQNKAPWQNPCKGLLVQRLNPKIFGDLQNKECWYLEFEQSEESLRSVFISS